MLSAAAFAFLAFSTSSQHARDALRELVEINTTESSGDTTLAAEAMARRLKSAGIDAADIKVLGPHPKRGNLIARLRGSSAGERPVLFLAHLDVVEAKREHWSMDPFKLIERDGYFYGRGTHDNKAGAAILVDMLTRLKRDGIRPKRDLIIALTARVATTTVSTGFFEISAN